MATSGACSQACRVDVEEFRGVLDSLFPMISREDRSECGYIWESVYHLKSLQQASTSKSAKFMKNLELKVIMLEEVAFKRQIKFPGIEEQSFELSKLSSSS